ncbi:M48 family metalloprotease [Ekhidna sp.]|uniref:M48 family metalloprotease n=1 Tax=Ekhidna sp. TaxID=2608089 RepID=UPI003514028A
MTSCSKTESLIDFTEEDEVLLGEKLALAISEDPDFSIIPSVGNSIPYGYVNSRLNEITSSAALTKSESFTWSITLLDDDTRQAFALPGGNLYVSTGMIFYLTNEDQFSGLLAFLVANVDRSYITERLFFKYGVNGLKSIATSGDDEKLKQIIEDLDLRGNYLVFSRANELASDTLSTSLLAGSGQACNGWGLFMDRALNVQPELISAFSGAHKLDQSRVENINAKSDEIGCDTTVDSGSTSRYQSFRNSLP